MLRRYVAPGSLAPDFAAAALEELAGLDVARSSHEPLLPRAWELRDNVTIYDAVYLALAEVLEAPLLTSDRRLANVPGHRATVELVAGRG